MTLDLSVHDKAVLNCIFNPSLPVTEAYDPEDSADLHDIEEESEFLESVKAKEVDAIRAAEQGNYEKALEVLNECVTILPGKPSIYNNRAQTYQFIGRFDDAFDDLSKAISLATKSDGKYNKTLCAALCQRGMVHRKYNRVELAREDYEKAAELGSKFAKTQLVEINPYAALCNQMLRKVMEDLK